MVTFLSTRWHMPITRCCLAPPTKSPISQKQKANRNHRLRQLHEGNGICTTRVQWHALGSLRGCNSSSCDDQHRTLASYRHRRVSLQPPLLTYEGLGHPQSHTPPCHPGNRRAQATFGLIALTTDEDHRHHLTEVSSYAYPQAAAHCNVCRRVQLAQKQTETV